MFTVANVMHTVIVTALLITACSACGSTRAAEPVKSGLQPGETLNSIFEPLNVTGPAAGEPHCLVCENGANPVVMIFAREPGEALVRLLAKVDTATTKNRNQGMGSFVVFLSEKEGLAERLKEVAAKHAIKHLVLSIDAPAGPEGFNVAADADVTVVLYSNHRVLANHAFRKGELNDAAIDKILADVPKLLSPK
jgi:hypothetical protein